MSLAAKRRCMKVQNILLMNLAKNVCRRDAPLKKYSNNVRTKNGNNQQIEFWFDLFKLWYKYHELFLKVKNNKRNFKKRRKNNYCKDINALNKVCLEVLLTILSVDDRLTYGIIEFIIKCAGIFKKTPSFETTISHNQNSTSELTICFNLKLPYLIMLYIIVSIKTICLLILICLEFF